MTCVETDNDDDDVVEDDGRDVITETLGLETAVVVTAGLVDITIEVKRL